MNCLPDDAFNVLFCQTLAGNARQREADRSKCEGGDFHGREIAKLSRKCRAR